MTQDNVNVSTGTSKPRWFRGARAWILSSFLALVCGWSITSCAFSRNADGSWSATFAPDMVITAWGLEDAKSQLYSLWRDCLAGTWTRPCSSLEITQIKDSYDDVIKKKGNLAAYIEEMGEPSNEDLYKWLQSQLSDAEWEALGLTPQDDLYALMNQ